MQPALQQRLLTVSDQKKENYVAVHMLISLIIPCYNSSRFIEETLTSILSQSMQDFEIILIDDGSTDNTSDIIRAFFQAHPDYQYRLFSQENRGVAAARNAGIVKSRGKYILLLDHDDKIHPNMLKQCSQVLATKNDIAIVTTDREDFGDFHATWEAGEFRLDKLKYFNQIAYCSMFRKSLWISIGGFRENVSGFDDWDFWIAAAALQHKAYKIAYSLFLHRRTRSSQLWDILDDYEKMFAQIVINNRSVYSKAEVNSANQYLTCHSSCSFIRLSKIIFLKQYYKNYG